MMKYLQINDDIFQFCQLLRQEGMKVSQADILVTFDALHYINLFNKEEVYYTLRAVLCRDQEDYKPFDRVFKGFWKQEKSYAGKEYEDDTTLKQDEVDDYNEDIIHKQSPSIQPPAEDGTNTGNVDGTFLEDSMLEFNKVGTYSPQEQLTDKIFMSHDTTDKETLQKQLYVLLPLIKNSLVKDRLINGRSQINFRQTIRKNIKYGGEEILRLYQSGENRNRYNSLVVLADVSGSMEYYIKLFLPLIYQLHRHTAPMDVFLFSTTIYIITSYLKKDYLETMKRLEEHLNKVSSGTNIGKSLKTFRQQSSTKLSPYMTTVIFLSDGWDRGNYDQLRKEIKFLRSSVYNIIWLNPLLGKNGYVPQTNAFEVVSPYVDHMISLDVYKSLLRNVK
ncbi:VWA domain-containing protein [Salicibibacter cibarius]|uniref:VWA domain-containing protein n=1 Tax=Salicibibacter cibarius TaxID=2743000 RepID=A0A7T6Z0V4_9BACI|nr:VWA domain-containing protein [Salicibibacter cibarius]QQK74723.1 VWA domain-containing protein [Salicibibacter cibarius]